MALGMAYVQREILSFGVAERPQLFPERLKPGAVRIRYR
jgi:hypothetical protein